MEMEYIKMSEQQEPKIKPGVCIPWEQKAKELPQILADEQLLQKVWEDVDSLGYMYIWQCLLSF